MKQTSLIGLLWGGCGREAGVSRQSADIVSKAIIACGYQVKEIEVTEGVAWLNQLEDCVVAFNLVHGTQGEDGTISALLYSVGIPYTGSGCKASALCFDKVLTKQVWKSLGGRTTEHNVFDLENLDSIVSAVGETELPVIVKPVAEGSSNDVVLIDQVNKLRLAMEQVLTNSDQGLIEPYLPGDEFTLGFMDDQYLGSIQIEPVAKVFDGASKHKLYDYAAKYDLDTTQFSTVTPDIEKELSGLIGIYKLFMKMTGIEGPSRIDFRMNEEGLACLMEVNTVPGMTSHSLLPMTAIQKGWSLEQLVSETILGARCKA